MGEWTPRKGFEMPKWARLKTTSDAPLGQRMGSLFENGYGDEGPMAKGCCAVLFVTFVFGPFLIAASLIAWFLWALFH